MKRSGNVARTKGHVGLVCLGPVHQVSTLFAGMWCGDVDPKNLRTNSRPGTRSLPKFWEKIMKYPVRSPFITWPQSLWSTRPWSLAPILAEIHGHGERPVPCKGSKFMVINTGAEPSEWNLVLVSWHMLHMLIGKLNAWKQTLQQGLLGSKPLSWRRMEILAHKVLSVINVCHEIYMNNIKT